VDGLNAQFEKFLAIYHHAFHRSLNDHESPAGYQTLQPQLFCWGIVIGYSFSLSHAAKKIKRPETLTAR
jgi:hypothetical protein